MKIKRANTKQIWKLVIAFRKCSVNKNPKNLAGKQGY